MGDTQVRCPMANPFEKGVTFGLIIHKSPFMAEDKDPLVLSTDIFELLEVNTGVAGFLIQLHPEDVAVVVESVTAHAEKGAVTKTTLYVRRRRRRRTKGRRKARRRWRGGGRRKDKPHNPLMISVQKLRIKPNIIGRGRRRVGFPDPSPTIPVGSVMRTQKPSSLSTPFAPQGSGSVSGMGSQRFFRAGGDSFPFWGHTSPYWRGRGSG